MRNAYEILVEKAEVKRSLWGPSHRWEDTTETDLKAVRCGGLNCIMWLRTGTNGGLLWSW